MPEGTEIRFGNFYKSDARTGVNIHTAKKLAVLSRCSYIRTVKLFSWVCVRWRERGSGLNQAKEIIRYVKFGNKLYSNIKDQEFTSECKEMLLSLHCIFMV